MDDEVNISTIKLGPPACIKDLSEREENLSNERIDQMIQFISEIVLRDYNAAKYLISTGKKNIHEFMTSLTHRPDGLNASQMPTSRETVQQVEIGIINEIAKEYFIPDQRIIEIGAGKLDENNCSYLMKRMPFEIQYSIEPTEVNRFISNQNQKHLKRVDCMKLGESYPMNSIDRVIGSAVLDTLSQPELIETLRHAHSVLKDDGFLIHFTSLGFFTDVFVSSFDHAEFICFPWMDVNQSFKGLQVIPINQFQVFVETDTTLPYNQKRFLEGYATMHPLQREQLINSMIMEETARSIAARNDLSTYINAIKPTSLTQIENHSFFKERVQQALAQTGFETVVFQYFEKSAITDRTSEHAKRAQFNYFSLIHGTLSRERCYVLAPNKIYQEVTMHVIVAKKLNGRDLLGPG